MSRSVREYLKHIRDEISYLESESAGIDKDEFLGDETRKRAFVRSIEVIGEAPKKIPEKIRDEYPQIQWRAIAGMRDHLIHGYFGIDVEPEKRGNIHRSEWLKYNQATAHGGEVCFPNNRSKVFRGRGKRE